MDPCRTCSARHYYCIELETRTEPKDDTARAPSINATKVGQGQGLPNIAGHQPPPAGSWKFILQEEPLFLTDTLSPCIRY